MSSRFIRGRTLSNTYVIVDDAQSLEWLTILDIISRLGVNSKIVFTYDMTQQDNRFVTRDTSIVRVVKDLQGQPCVAHIDFDRSVRSHLAQLAGDMLASELG